MNKHLLILMVLLIVLIFFGCKPPEVSTSFQEVSQPYLDEYGPPEDIYTYASDCYYSVDWWWWSKGFEVTFVDSCYDDVNGWSVASTYSFPPI